MKFLLAVLLSFIMTEAPVLAIHGGYTLGGSASLTGTYAGVLIPESVSGSLVSFGSNSLGLFTLSIPTVGLGTGAAIIFATGRTFAGTIQALPDPASGGNGILGVLTAELTDLTTSGTFIDLDYAAEGSFDATTVADADSVGSNGIDLTGSSLVQITPDVTASNSTTEQVTFLIDGFLQSTTPTTTTTTTTSGG